LARGLHFIKSKNLMKFSISQKQVIVKGTQRKGFLTSRVKMVGNVKFYLIAFPWSEKDNKAFKDFWGYDRKPNDLYDFCWLPVDSLQLVR